jgi:transcriptional regulator with XRE-family HTH domain
MTSSTLPSPSPRVSIHLSRGALRRALAVRGIDQQELATAANLSEATISHAASGYPVATRTLQRIATALESIPVLPGAAELVTPIE